MQAKRDDDAENADADNTSPGTKDREGKEEGKRLSHTPEVIDMTFSDIVLDVASRVRNAGETMCIIRTRGLLGHLTFLSDV